MEPKFADLWMDAYNEKDPDVQQDKWESLYKKIGNAELYEAFNAYMYVKAEGIQAAKDFILD